MKRILYFVAIMGLITIVAGSCKKEDKFSVSDLVGRWQNTSKTAEFTVYTLDNVEDKEGYYWGKRWNTDDRQEGDLEEHKNGWFAWKLSEKTLTRIEMMNNGWADIATSFTVTVLSDSVLSIQNTDGSRPQSFHKIAEE